MSMHMCPPRRTHPKAQSNACIGTHGLSLIKRQVPNDERTFFEASWWVSRVGPFLCIGGIEKCFHCCQVHPTTCKMPSRLVEQHSVYLQDTCRAKQDIVVSWRVQRWTDTWGKSQTISPRRFRICLFVVRWSGNSGRRRRE